MTWRTVTSRRCRRAGALAASALVLASLTACGSAAAPASGSGSSKPAPVALRSAINGTSPSTTYFWVAKDNGLFEQHGLAVDLQNMNGSAAMGALIGGDVDFLIHTGPSLVLSAYANGTPLKILGAMEDVYDEILVAPSSITSVEQLRGKKIGGSSLSSANTLAAKRLLADHGMQAGKDYTLVETGSSASEAGIAAQLLSHQIDAGALTTDFADKLVAQGGFHVLVDFAETDVHVASQVVTLRTPFIAQHRDVVQRLVDSLFDAARYYKSHKAEAVAAMRLHYKLEDQAQMEKLWERQSELLAKVPTVAKEDFADIISQLPKDTPALSDDKLAALLDLSFVNDAAKRGLGQY